MEKTYNPTNIEKKCYQRWEASGYFKPSKKGEPFCIMIPPPNVTGSLHMGHAFQQTLMDVLTRYHRMKGDNTLWQVGTDHAGIATQLVVEAQLQQKGETKEDLGRDAFVDKIWAWKAQSDGRIKEQLKRMGSSLDWSRERFTLDEDISNAVHYVFEQLFDEGLIYCGTRLVNWDPILLTAVSDLEVESQEKQGHLWHIRYPIADSSEYVIVATTRPETMLGDTAVAIHPDDARYQHLIGKQIKLPLTDRLIPIIADEYVDAAFGSGCVKITPAHDFNDYEIGKRHDLPMINLFTQDAKLNKNTPKKYQDLDRFEARNIILDDLKHLALLEKVEDHTLKMPICGRSGAIVEPYLTDQWFVKAKPLAEPAIDAVKKGELTFVPQNWENTYFQWLENIQDWCISRQLWWGHRIPAWYDDQGNCYVAASEAKVREKYQLGSALQLKQDDDVLDTWFSSALWPFATLGWPEQTFEMEMFYPTNILVTGFDIIFFWVARMMMMGLKFTGKSPFHTVYIHGLIRDESGQKMSKSKGNVIDPIDLIDGISLDNLIAKRTQHLIQPAKANKIKQNTKKTFPEGIPAFGTDALRFTYCALASFSRDIQFDLKRIEGYRNFCNKLWNAARYVFMNLEKQSEDILTTQSVIYSVADRWILDQLQWVIERSHEAIATYRFDVLAQILYEFTWNEYCDWYLEFSKVVLNNSESSQAAIAGTCQTLIHVLDAILRLLHPIMPFITETIWQKINGEDKTIMLATYPEQDATKRDGQVVQHIAWVKNIIVNIRNIRGEMNIPPNKSLRLIFHEGTEQDKENAKASETMLLNMGKVVQINWAENMDDLGFSATAVLGELELYVPLEGIIDQQVEIDRLEKAIKKLNKELAQSEHKLSNKNYIDKAPAEVVEKEKQKVHTAKSTISKLQKQLKKLA